MIMINEFVAIVAQEFTNGDVGIAGLITFTAVMGLMFAIFGRKSITVPFVLMLPLTVVFTTLGILNDTMTILLVIVSVLALAMVARNKVAD